MFGKDKQQKNFKKQQRAIRKALKLYAAKRDPEALHKLRVGIKKMRALLFLSENTFNRRKLPKSFDAVRTLFRASGHIRAAQVNLQLLREHNVRDDKAAGVQRALVRRATENLVTEQQAYEKAFDKSCEKLAKRFHDLESRQVIHRIEKQLKQLTEDLRAATDPEQFHDCRKILKNIVYLGELLPKRIVHALRLNLAYLDKLETTIGGLHDLMLLTDMLRESSFDNKKVLQRLARALQVHQRAVRMLARNFRQKAHALPKPVR